MTKQSGFRGKPLLSVVCLLFILSIGFNIYQYNTIRSERKENTDMSRYYVSEQAVTFSNVFSEAGRADILAYMKNPDHISKIIEGIQVSEEKHLAATKFLTSKPNGKSLSTVDSRNLILNGYLQELRKYRTYLDSNSNGSYEDIDQVAIVMSDLQAISNWLMIKYKNNDFEAYSDEDFYKDVYGELKSDIKKYYFVGFRA